MTAYPLPRGPNRIRTQPSWADRLRSSKALLPTLAVMGVTVLALAAALLVTRSQAEPDVNPVFGATAVSEVANEKAVVVTPKPIAAKPVVAKQVVTKAAPVVVAAAPVCGNCGRVEAVTTVQRKGSGSGVGAVAGGVLGGVLGNQVGGGSGRTIATVIGAVGGGYAGNEVEKNVNKQTLYQISVRMSDGSIRSFEQASAIAVGASVRVENNSLRLAPA